LKALEVYVPFEPSDRIVTLGDYVNRGPESRSVLEWLIERKKMGGLIPLRGNHEAMMCAARESARHYDEWISSGGDATLTSYTNRNVEGSLALVPAEHWHFLEYDCRSYFETKTHFFVHANVYPDVPLDEQPDHMLYWEPFNDPPAHDSGKIMVCGHTPQRNGFPRDIGHAVCIDTGIYRGG
jgi:serine/threonine protein phosphatase 1